MITTLPHQSAYDLIKTLLSEKSGDTERQAMFQDLVERPITADLLTEGVRALRESMVPTHLHSDAIDTCGTGGSGLKTINTSTLTALIVAAAGGKVAKHGNRSASGNCGCFDLLEELGVKIDLNPDQERRAFEQLGITFLFARLHHPALRFVAPLRKKYGKKTLFNLIGPLCNPAGVSRQMIGTGSEEDAEIIAETLYKLGSFGSIVVTGRDGLDEVTITDGTTVRRVSENGVQTEEFSPESLSVPLALPSEIRGGTAKENARLFLELAQGKGNAAMKNLILLNAAHAMLLTPLATTIEDALRVVRQSLDSGAAYNLFRSYHDLTHRL
ncbi:MAG: anthranilate phosphoribosyltransferase [Candidatus Peribacter sp.]|jgi:anthranilate phosphoribosyltransferase